MEFALVAVALATAVAALVFSLTLRSRLDAVERSATAAKGFEDDARRAHESMHSELEAVKRLLDQTRRELDATRGELAQLKAAAEVLAEPPPPPPLPRTRSGGLDDLRQQLRAAHREGDDADET
jgi:hypothetical protein